MLFTLAEGVSLRRRIHYATSLLNYIIAVLSLLSVPFVALLRPLRPDSDVSFKEEVHRNLEVSLATLLKERGGGKGRWGKGEGRWRVLGKVQVLWISRAVRVFPSRVL